MTGRCDFNDFLDTYDKDYSAFYVCRRVEEEIAPS
jgi:hypothetical protein